MKHYKLRHDEYAASQDKATLFEWCMHQITTPEAIRRIREHNENVMMFDGEDGNKDFEEWANELGYRRSNRK